MRNEFQTNAVKACADRPLVAALPRISPPAAAGVTTAHRLLIRIWTALFLMLGLALQNGEAVVAQNRPVRLPRGPRIVVPAGRRNAQRANALDRPSLNAVAILRRMLHPLAEYSGEETTWIARQNGRTSKQIIKGDTQGNVVRYYTSPDFLQGDIMLTGPGKYIYYRAATKTAHRSAPGNEDDERDKQIIKGVHGHVFTAAVTGQDLIAGNNAVIIVVTAVNPMNHGYAKFWIEPNTGIKLKIELADPDGNKISTSEITRLQIGPNAGVTAKDFAPPEFATSAANEIVRQKVKSIQEAIPLLPFRPLEPAVLPMGFHLKNMMVVLPQEPDSMAKRGFFLHYTDGVASFTLHERVIPKQRFAAPPSAPGKWRIPSANGEIEVTYRGHLPPQYEQQVRDSLQPAN